MDTCPKCGSKTDEGVEFCPSCGTPLTNQASKPFSKERRAQEDVCFGEREHHPDYSGMISFGIFLLIVGVIFLMNQNIFSDFQAWIEQMAQNKSLERPRPTLISSAALFFGLVGISDFLVAGIRLLSSQSKRRVVADILTGAALILFSYLIYLYAAGSISWQSVLAIEAVVCGFLIIFYSAVRHMIRGK